jgi:cytidylate kinase
MPSDTLVVAIDGPSGSGKSTVSRAVARRLGLRYLDTGAQYRAMTYWMQRHGVDLDDPDAVAAAATAPEIVSRTDPAAPGVTVDGEDATVEIRTAEVTAAVSAVAAVPAVRARLIALQREIIGDGGVVVEGRDIAAVVAPDAPVKVYLTASPEVRAARRNAEHAGAQEHDVADTLDDLARRDAADSRTTRPLEAATGAVVVDATDLAFGEVVNRVIELTGVPAARA